MYILHQCHSCTRCISRSAPVPFSITHINTASVSLMNTLHSLHQCHSCTHCISAAHVHTASMSLMFFQTSVSYRVTNSTQQHRNRYMSLYTASPAPVPLLTQCHTASVPLMHTLHQYHSYTHISVTHVHMAWKCHDMSVQNYKWTWMCHVLTHTKWCKTLISHDHWRPSNFFEGPKVSELNKF
jgi:hypothetical protein